jgi:RNA polymerase sigma factor (sigma-70 family)
MERNREAKFDRLFEEHSARLLNAVRTRVAADDTIIQDACTFAWMTVWRRVDVDLDAPTLFGYLYVTAVREAWRLAREQTASLIDVSEIDAPSNERASADVISDRDAIALIGQLPERQAQVITLAALGYSREEMATILGWTVRTVDRQLGRARDTLRKLL